MTRDSELIARLRKFADGVDLLDGGSAYTISMRRETRAILNEAASRLEAIGGPVGWETPEEWALEQEVFNAANHSDVPDWARKTIADLWRQYCIAASPTPSDHVAVPVETIRNAVLSCSHTITAEEIVLRRSDKMDGNALNQLHQRLTAALIPTKPEAGESDWPYPEAWRDDKFDDEGDLTYLWRVGDGSFTLNFLTSGTVVATYVQSDPQKCWSVKLGATSPVQTREDGIREAAALVRGNAIIDSSDGQSLRARTDGNRAGLAYADAIEALLSQPEPKGDKT